MMSRRTRERGVKRSAYRALNDLQSELKKPLTKAPTCPYCGSPMVYEHRSKRIDTYYDNMMYVCKNYPECDCYCRVREHKGKRFLVSTPANRNLRALRNEAHYYFKQILDNGIFDTEAALYNAISPQLPTFTSDICSQIPTYTTEVVHIGECKETMCMSIINICIGILYKNKEKVKNFRPWDGTKTDEDHMKMLRELATKDKSCDC